MGESRNRDEATDIETHTTETHFLILRPAAKTLCSKANPPNKAVITRIDFLNAGLSTQCLALDRGDGAVPSRHTHSHSPPSTYR